MSLIKKSFAMISFSLLAFSLASAQTITPEVSTSTPSEPEKKAVIVAGVNVTDVNLSQKEGAIIQGNFSLQGTMGQQNDIVYGIIVVNDKNEFIDVVKMGELPSLKQGELKSFPILYRYPTFIDGKVRAMVAAETSDGLILGAQVLYEGEKEGNGNTLSCSLSAEQVTCKSTIDTALTISYYSNGLFGTKISDETKQVSAGKSVSFDTKFLSAGSYAAIIKNNVESGFARLRIVKEGTFGKFVNVMVYEKSPGLVSFVATFNSTEAANIRIKLKDASGNPCGEEIVIPNVNFVAEKEFPTSCPTGNVEASLGVVAAITDDENAVLDVYSGSFDVVAVQPEAPKGVWSFANVLIGALLLLLVVGYLLYRNYKKPMTPTSQTPTTPSTPPPQAPVQQPIQSTMGTPIRVASVLFLFIVLSLISMPKANAYTVRLFDSCTSRCTTDSTIWATLSLDKSSYNPNDIITFIGNFSSDDHPQGAPISVYGAATINGGSAQRRSFWPSVTAQDLRDGVSGSGSIGNAPATGGNYYVRTGAGADGYYGYCCTDIQFSVVAPASIKVFFSMLTR